MIGGLVSSYHYLIEKNPSLSKGSCDLLAPCNAPWFWQFGFMTIAFMALCGFAAIISLLTLGEGDHPDHSPEES